MHVLKHHIYEYKKGLRRLILFTCNSKKVDDAIDILKKLNISFVLLPIRGKNVNIFFGDSICLDVIKVINKKALNEYTAEEDFILGVMLGYDRKQQCQRYLDLKSECRLAV